MSILHALILGIVQGITEFLPVSSSGHLVLLEKLLGITEQGMAFPTAVHGGTLIAVFVALRNDIWDLLRRIAQPLTLKLIIATIPAVIAALLFRTQIEKAFSTGVFLGFSFLITSFLLIFSEWIFRRRSKPGGFPEIIGNDTPKTKLKNEMTFFDALFIGILQAVAIIPGVSRSGATISAALFRRIDRDFAARFSFLLSIPAILGAFVLHIKEIRDYGAEAVDGLGFLPIIVGTISAAITGFFAIKFMIKIVREHSLVCFAIYTGVLGLLIIIDQFITNFFF